MRTDRRQDQCRPRRRPGSARPPRTSTRWSPSALPESCRRCGSCPPMRQVAGAHLIIHRQPARPNTTRSLMASACQPWAGASAWSRRRLARVNSPAASRLSLAVSSPTSQVARKPVRPRLTLRTAAVYYAGKPGAQQRAVTADGHDLVGGGGSRHLPRAENAHPSARQNQICPQRAAASRPARPARPAAAACAA